MSNIHTELGSDQVAVSIIIVNYNTCMLTQQCLESIYKNTQDIKFEIILIDNASIDDSVAMVKKNFPDVILIESKRNLGFGRANNLGLNIAKGKYVLFLNSDTYLINNAIKMFYDYWEANGEHCIGALGGILLNSQQETIHSGGILPDYKVILKRQVYRMLVNTIKTVVRSLKLAKWFTNKFHVKEKTTVLPGAIGYVTGADLFMKNTEYARFDPNYFMYYEEADMQLNLAKKGYKMLIIEGPQIVHLSKKDNPNMELVFKTDIFSQLSSLYYLKKNYGCHANLLRFLIWIDWHNPYIYKTTKTYLNEIWTYGKKDTNTFC